MSPQRRANPLTHILSVLIVLLIVAGLFGVRFAIAGGDIGCFWANDPALCVAVKEVGK